MLPFEEKKKTRGVCKQSTKRSKVSHAKRSRFKGKKPAGKVQKKSEKIKGAKFGNHEACETHRIDTAEPVVIGASTTNSGDSNETPSSKGLDVKVNRVISASEKKLSTVAKEILSSQTDTDSDTGTDASCSTSRPTGVGDDYDTELSTSHAGSPKMSSSQAYNQVESGYRIIWTDNLVQCVNKLHRCNGANLKLVEKTKQGLHSEMGLKCSHCGRVTAFPTSCPNEETKNPTRQGVDINRRATFAALEIGIGREALATVCEILELPTPVHSKSYQAHEESILHAQVEIVEKHLKEARAEARAVSIRNDGLDPSDESLTADIPVSFDGTWSKRGYTANNGIAFVISADTGKVLDYAVQSKYCQQCKCNEAVLDDAQFQAFLATHTCEKNHEGSSSSMEVSAAEEIWKRSATRNEGLRYRYMISDGDSKAYNAIRGTYGLCDLCSKYNSMPKSSNEYKQWIQTDEYQKYVNDHEEEKADCMCVYKLDCVGHVQKRLGKHLRALHKAGGVLTDNKSVKGKSGRLTEPAIDRIQKYYGNAIRKSVNPNATTKEEIDSAVTTMRTAIKAVLHHSVATPNPQERHKFCPDGPESWCRYKRTGEDKTQKYHFDAPFLDFLTPTFDNLSTDNLLKRCLPGYTQNNNESLNGMVWVRAPKHKWHGAKRVRIALTSAILRFNVGAGAREDVMKTVKIHKTTAVQAGSKKKDITRVKSAIRKSTETQKRARQKVREAKHAEEERLKQKEGTTYSAGAYDDDVMVASARPKRQKRK